MARPVLSSWCMPSAFDPQVCFVFLAVLAACGASTNAIPDATTPDAAIADATTADAGGTNGGAVATCGLSYSAFNASPSVNTQSTYAWSCTATTRLLTGTGIPDHPVTTGSFATPVGPQNISITFPLKPEVSAKLTTRFRQPYGYALNSVKFDPETAATCQGTATSTARDGGCVMVQGKDPWVIEAIGGAFKFATDESNAHTQPNGQYHYHGMPEGMITRQDALTLVGFALDGFPIYARYGYSTPNDASSGVKVMKAGWQRKASPDAGRPNTAAFPMGTFTSDWEYVQGSGDLDECNGRTGVTPEYPQGTYHYYITDTYPFIQRCLRGTML